MSKDDLEFIDMIDTLTNEERIELREFYEQFKLELPRNLYYNYQLQKWIQ